MADPNLGDIVTYTGMGIGAAIAALLVRLGWKKAPMKDTEVAIAGQATIVDTAPLKELLKNVDLLTMQWQKVTTQIDISNQVQHEVAASNHAVAQSIERLTDVMANYLANQTERQEREDTEREIERRAEERAKEIAEEQKKPRARGHVVD
jgi:hypothetical protein